MNNQIPPSSITHPTFHFCNINSFFSHKTQIKTVLSNEPQTAALALCETHIDPNNTKSIKIPGFIACNFPYKKKSSGILVYVRKQYPSKVLEELTFEEDGSMAVFIDINIANTCNIRLGTIYIRPTSTTSTLRRALSAISKATTNQRQCIFLGDFNCRHKAWGDNITTPKAKHLLEMCEHKHINILNILNTPSSPTHGNSVLDLALTNKPHSFHLSINKIDITSDHSPLTCTWLPPISLPSTPSAKPTWNIPKANWKTFKTKCDSNFTNLLPIIRNLTKSISKHNINKMSHLITHHLNKAAEYSIPLKVDKDHAKDNQELKELNRKYCNLHNKCARIKRRIMKREALGIPNTDLTSALPKVKAALASAKTKWEIAYKRENNKNWEKLTNKIQAANKKEVSWKIWRRTIPTNNHPLNSITLHKQSPLPTTMKESLNNMAEFYSNTMSDRSLPDWETSRPSMPSEPNATQRIAAKVIQSKAPLHPHILDKDITTKEVKRAIKQGNANTAPGIDGIPAHFLRHLPTSAVQVITLFYNYSWTSGYLPDGWKAAKSFCLYKSGPTSNPASYRIISITSILCRTLERIIKERLTTYLEAKNFFHASQNGFRYRRSTIDHIRTLQDAIYKSIKQKRNLPVVFLDIIKAFDRVPHDLLLLKLYSAANISGRAWKWIQDFLTNRTFHITQGPHTSKPVTATAGVPQGSVLSPLLFIIYINDIATLTNLNIELAIFADDIAGWPKSLSARIPTQMKQMSLWLQHIDRWSHTWRLDFSNSKSNLVTFTKKRNMRPQKKLHLDSKPILSKEAYKYLGIAMDEDGTNKTQLASNLQKTRHTAYYIGRISNRKSGPLPTIIIKLIKAILIPQISYGICLLHTPLAYIHSINTILSSPLKKTLGLGKHTSSLRTLWDCGIPDAMSIKESNILQYANNACKRKVIPPASQRPSIIINKQVPSDFSSKLQNVMAKHCIPTLPIKIKDVKILTKEIQRSNFFENPTISEDDKKRKQEPDTARYLLVDPRPTVSIRSRLRLNVDLSFARLHKYKIRTSSKCDLCGNPNGDTDHLLLHCPAFEQARADCRMNLQNITPKETLCKDIILGHLPKITLHKQFSNRKHKQQLKHHDLCLQITAKYLTHISSKLFL